MSSGPAGTRLADEAPTEVAARVCSLIEEREEAIWITRVPPEELMEAARRLDDADPRLPLYGVPFAVKDNIDVAGLPTTAGCPGAARVASDTAPPVKRLLDAGALLVGKTNMDQFATGLVGTRSPYGACSSVFDRSRVSGGSSSGSALAVALGLVSFALGTDTAGSGRVPAAFNGIVGLKPTRGLVSTRGVVPACASLDCVSVFARDVACAAGVLRLVSEFDPLDPWSRRPAATERAVRGVIGIPLEGQAVPDGAGGAAAWARTQELARELWTTAPVDVSPLLEAAPLLYGVWIAERAASLGALIRDQPDGLDPTVAALIRGGESVTGVEVFRALHRLAELRAAAGSVWDGVDALILPTAPAHPTHVEVAADPVAVNERLGRFGSFANLIDLAALTLPGPRQRDGLPFGVTLFAPAFEDRRLLELGAAWLSEDLGPGPRGPGASSLTLAVAGAHMRGLPLNSELTARGARFVRAGHTAPHYRLHALPGPGVRRPGLIRTDDGGEGIELELWEIPQAGVGSLLAGVPAPLAIGRIELDDGTEVSGFVCEGYAAAGAEDVTAHGGWRAYLQSAGA